MKSLLAFRGIEYPKIHDLELLADILNEHDIGTTLYTELLIELSDYAVEGRYAFIQEDIENVEKYISMLNNALAIPLH